MRRICRVITIVYLLLSTFIFLSKDPPVYSRELILLAWFFSLFALPLARWVIRVVLASYIPCSAPVIIIGSGETARAVIRGLRMNKILGFDPVACLDDAPDRVEFCEGVPVLGTLEDAQLVAHYTGARHAIVAIPSMDRERLIWYLRRWRQFLARILIVPNLAGIASLWTEPRDLGGLLGLEIQHHLLSPWNQMLKRAIDIVGASVGIILAAPLIAVCAVWIKLVSPGRAFYVQVREGQGGKNVEVLKLRTMYPEAEEMLGDYLARNPNARAEWKRYCKLKSDPRVLPVVGKLLRGSSLDETPQLWNVLKGEMSLVGPRPFPAYHNSRFDAEFRTVRTQVKPGLTGLWQVSARSEGDLTVQQALDSYYIRNWSLWLDVYILFRTVRAVLARRGAC
jgi:Undecaprenyl-phosphate galactose phosphotransferase WbaP